MFLKRVVVMLCAVIACTAYGLHPNTGFAAGQAAKPGLSGPSLGRWEFSGKDDAGAVWTGTLTIAKPDPSRFDAKLYFAICRLSVRTPKKGLREVEAPCKYEQATRTLSFATSMTVAWTYTAVLAGDGKSLTNGKWSEAKGVAELGSGTWSAKLSAR